MIQLTKIDQGQAGLKVKFYQTRDFRQLEKEWERRLLTSGFRDAELMISHERVLKQHSANAYKQKSPEEIQDKENYFRALSQNVYLNQFAKFEDKLIMSMTADGYLIKQIVEQMLRHDYKIHRQTIRFIIRRYEHDWGLRFWTPKQRNLRHG